MTDLAPAISRLVNELINSVDAAIDELDLATAFHETWKPMVYDESLLLRMGESFATNAFLVIRTALRREMLLALMRMWDTSKMKEGIRMTVLAEHLRDEEVINALVELRTADVPAIGEHIRSLIIEEAAEVLRLVRKWIEGGSHASVLKKLRTLRNEILAHRQRNPSGAGPVTPEETEVEEFFQDNLTLIRLLTSIVKGVAYNPNDTASIFMRNAQLFWTWASGENTRGYAADEK